MPQQEEHLRDYLQLIRKHDFTICLSVLLVLGIALIVSLRLPKTYTASTLILFVQPSTTPSLSSTNLFQNVLSVLTDVRWTRPFPRINVKQQSKSEEAAHRCFALFTPGW